VKYVDQEQFYRYLSASAHVLRFDVSLCLLVNKDAYIHRYMHTHIQLNTLTGINTPSQYITLTILNDLLLIFIALRSLRGAEDAGARSSY